MDQSSRPRSFLAWAVHLLTASGAVLALLALSAIERGDFRLALLWLLVALAIDGIDGTLARKARVQEHAPRIDGPALDLIIDYLNYVFIPTVMIWKARLLPEPLALPLAALILLSALYNFTRRDMKTEDFYFRGFPALWNVVALYLIVAQPGPNVAAVGVILLALLTFAPVHFAHPLRVRDFQPWLLGIAALWAISTAALLWRGWSVAATSVWLGVSLGCSALLVVVGLIRSVRGAR
jgi:phosphatidylcholine synthase